MTNLGLSLADELVAEGSSTFTFSRAQELLGKKPSTVANLLVRMEKAGLVDRVRRGHYAIRPLGRLGTPTVVEDIALAVGAALKDLPHRIAYQSALHEHDLLVQPVRSIQVAAIHPVRTRKLSTWPVKIVIESPENLEVGKVAQGISYFSDLHRAILDAARRPILVGGLEVLAGVLTVAAPNLSGEILMDYASRLNWTTAIRRLGSLVDGLNIEELRGALNPVKPISADLDLIPSYGERRVWRDKRWCVRWPCTVDELLTLNRY